MPWQIVGNIRGAVGERGPQGLSGDSVSGPPGPPGESVAGPRGPEGPPGKFLPPNPWAKGVNYQSALVTYGGSTYCAARDTAEQPPHDDWTLVAAAGADGRSFTVRGTWSASTTYRAADVVALEGSSFVARADDPGACPGDGWQLIAAKGNRGKPGEIGPRGPAGPGIKAAAIDDQGMLTLMHDDGSVVTCDFYPLLTRIAR